MRVVFLTHNFPRWPGDVSGSFLATLAHALIDVGHQVTVLAPSDGGETGPAEFEGIPVKRIRYSSPGQETIAYRGNMQDAIRHPAGWKALVRLWRALRRASQAEVAQGADVVHAHWWVPGGLAAPTGVPLVLTVHGTDGALLRRSAMARWVATPIFRRAKVVTAVSRSLADTIQSATGCASTLIQPMPVDVARYKRWSEGGDGLVIVSRFTPQKRVELGLHALAVLRDRGRGRPLRIIGDGPGRPGLETLTKDLGLETLVRFEGTVPPGEIPDRIGNADLMLFPAVGEGFGLVAAESLMCGVPVVACRDGGGILDVVPESGAGRISEPDPAAIATAVDDLLADPKAAMAARQLGTDWRIRLDPGTVARACDTWYRTAASP